MQFCTLLLREGAEEDTGYHEEGTVLQVVRCVEGEASYSLGQCANKGSCFIDEEVESSKGHWATEVVFKWLSYPFPVILADETDAGSEELAKQPSGIVVCCLDVLVGVPIKGFHVLWLRYYAGEISEDLHTLPKQTRATLRSLTFLV